MPMTIEELRAWLADKRARGVKQVRVTTMEEALPGSPAEAWPDIDARQVKAFDKAVKAAVAAALADEATLMKALKGRLIGTAEAAEMLHVERPRIGRWREMNMLPEPVEQLAAGPVWLRSQIAAKVDEVMARKKPRRQVEAA